MFSEDESSDLLFKVVINHEEQYSIWPTNRENPAGWRDESTVGTRDYCLRYIDQVWTDMRPLSLRRALEEQAHSLEPKPD